MPKPCIILKGDPKTGIWVQSQGNDPRFSVFFERMGKGERASGWCTRLSIRRLV